MLVASRAVVGMARQVADNGGSASSFHETLQQAVQDMDTNGDGYLNAAEFRGPESLFRKWDANRDGQLTQSEIAEGIQRSAQERALQRNVATALRTQDADRDGVLRPEEMGVRGREFDKIDRDGDGVVNRDELARVYGSEVG